MKCFYTVSLTIHDKYAIKEEMASNYTEVPVNPCRSRARGILRRFCWPRIMHRRERNKGERFCQFCDRLFEEEEEEEKKRKKKMMMITKSISVYHCSGVFSYFESLTVYRF